MWKGPEQISLPRNATLEYNSSLITVAKCAEPKCKTYLAIIDNGCGRYFIDERVVDCKCTPVEIACEEHRKDAKCTKVKKQKIKK